MGPAFLCLNSKIKIGFLKSKIKIKTVWQNPWTPGPGHRSSPPARRPQSGRLPGGPAALAEHVKQHSSHGMASVQGAWRVRRISIEKRGLASLKVKGAALFSTKASAGIGRFKGGQFRPFNLIMNYTYQTHTESGCFAFPQPDDVRHATNKTELRRALERWADTVASYSDEPAALMVWHGKHDDITNLYPSFECRLGKRGGFRVETV